MMPQPRYFEPIREAAAKRWEQLEQDSELAAPWHLLFKQVQSPRHVLSELLQNADDAGATETSVGIDKGSFTFTHNGEDFIEEHFASLCRFGYSNKRALHTIGFRGIGFKSTFSLGNTVELHTPTLSVAFRRQRFTEPCWMPSVESAPHTTSVHVQLVDEHREREIRKNLEEWLKSPISLLFFKHIRKMRIADRDVYWESLGPGPVPRSEWMALNGNADEAYLIARSAPEEFPEEALDEIRQERLLTDDQLGDFPPSTVEIVSGTKGQLYVVLPTGVETSLPFASNAPFIQDPARLKIKDPETSPTNRWLLHRIGKLAASVMLDWVGQRDASLTERSLAYNMFPEADDEDQSFEGTCSTIVKEAFGEEIAGKPFLLTHTGGLTPAKDAVIVPDDVLEVWPAEQGTAFLDDSSRPAFSPYVSHRNRNKLIHWDVVDQIEKHTVLAALQSKHLPKPDSWGQLLRLWVYIAPEVTGYNWLVDKTKLRILPVQSKDVLYSSSEIVRLGEKRLLQSGDDWDFLATHLLVLNQNWPRFLAEQRRASEEDGADGVKRDVLRAFSVLASIGLSDASDVSKVLEQVSAEFFRQEPVSLADCVRLAQIAAKLGATTGASFRFVTQNGHLLTKDKHVICDQDGSLETLLSKDWCSTHLLHPSYLKSFTSCTRDEWLRWVSTGQAGLLGLVPFLSKGSTLLGRKQVEAEVHRRGFADTPFYPYVTDHFIIEDWDFERAHWQHWANLAKDEPSVWSQIVERLVAQPDNFWSKARSARASQVATTGSRKAIVQENLLPSWILRLRQLPCLPDTHGSYHKPTELLMRTPETEPLLDVEPFVHGRLDREASRPLLKLLGVRDVPISPAGLLDCLRALAKAESPPIHEVEKWYRRLDQLIDTCSTPDMATIKNAFRSEKIILTENVIWTNAVGVFLSSNEDDVPGAEVIRRSVQDLALWRKVDVADRPTEELAIAWLKQLPSGETLSKSDLRRVRALLARHAVRIWNECGHWLNLAGEWVPVATLRYGLSMQSLVPWSHMHEWVKQQTADLQQLSLQTTGVAPFAGLGPLAARIEERFKEVPLLSQSPVPQVWLKQLGVGLQRVKLDSEEETSNIRLLGRDLTDTVWQVTGEIELVPYIDGVPAGLPRSADAVWLNKILYVKDRPPAKLARVVSQELGRIFRRPDVVDAVKLCFDRSAKFVTEYMEENFTLLEDKTIPESARQTHLSATAESNPLEAESPTPSPSLTADPHPNDQEYGNEESRHAAAIQESTETPEPISTTHHEYSVTKTPKPSIIERFAQANGFRMDSENRFFHPDGSWIAKPPGLRFWERRRANGELVRCYWPKDHCLRREPLQLEADVWGLIDRNPDVYALVLSDIEDHPIEVTGESLRTMCDSGEIKLYPATYRLVYRDALE